MRPTSAWQDKRRRGEVRQEIEKRQGGMYTGYKQEILT